MRKDVERLIISDWGKAKEVNDWFQLMKHLLIMLNLSEAFNDQDAADEFIFLINIINARVIIEEEKQAEVATSAPSQTRNN